MTTETRTLHTIDSLEHDLRGIGVRPADTLMVHTSLKALGRVCGGPVAVILALERAVGADGTIVMPTMTLDLCDPSEEENPYPETEWDLVRRSLPTYHPDLSPTTSCGVVPDTFRKQDGVQRSSHPHLSFAAWGARAAEIVADHSFDHALGEKTPLGRLYDTHGTVLLLGASKNTNSIIHLAEYRQREELRGRKDWAAPVLVDGATEWRIYHDVMNSDADFDRIQDAFQERTGLVRSGTVGDAASYLMPVRELVDFAVEWMNANRQRKDP